MKFARFEYNDKIYDGLVDTEEVNVIRGSFWNHYVVTGQKYNISAFYLP